MNRSSTKARHQRGFALILVLWMSVALAALALTIVARGSGDVVETRNLLTASQARHLAEGGIHRAIHALNRAQLTMRADAEGVYRLRQAIEGGLLHIEVRNETGRVDVNYAETPLLQAAFRAAGAGVARSEELARDIEAKRGGDGDKAGTLFQDLSELRRLPGMTDRLWQNLHPFVTVWSRIGHIHPRFADFSLLQALPELQPADLQMLTVWRQAAAGRDQLPPLAPLPRGEDYFSQAHANAYRITARVAGDSFPALQLQAVVWLPDDGAGTPLILNWRELPAPAV